MSQEFRFMDMSMEKISCFYGLFLIIWGFLISSLSGSNSFTSYIPSILGSLIFVFALLAIFIPSKKKLFMHIVVTFGLIIFIGGLDILRNYSNIFDIFWADLSKLMMLISGLFFTYLCVKSFIHARRQKAN